jgi:hypothetical protein
MLWVALLLVAFGAIALLLVIASVNGCSDSPTGEHEEIMERTPTGVCLRCMFCGRMTAGIDAFHRKV